MSQSTELVLWGGTEITPLPPNLTAPEKIVEFAKQLSPHERDQVSAAYQSGFFELATPFVWGRAMASLKRMLGSLGLSFLAEILGRTDISENDDVLEVISEREAIRLAAELGVVSPTEAIRLRHSQELVSHFAQREARADDEPMEAIEAIGILTNCIRTVLGRPQISVAQKFSDFRRALEQENFTVDSPHLQELPSLPYFFQRLSLTVLLHATRTSTGAKLERVLGNLNLLLPLLWPNLKDNEKWLVGTTYSQVYADGLQIQTSGLKSALLKVRGFDFVPETLRSQTFIQAALAIIRAHEGLNNFYAEEAPTSALEKLGAIPAPALGPCFTALLCVCLGNRYGTCWNAVPIAERLLKAQSPDRWMTYLDKVLPGDVRILEKLGEQKPRERWIAFMQQVDLGSNTPKNQIVRYLLNGTMARNDSRVARYAERILSEYYFDQNAPKT